MGINLIQTAVQVAVRLRMDGSDLEELQDPKILETQFEEMG